MPRDIDLPDFSEIFAYPARKSLTRDEMDSQELMRFKTALLPYFHRYMITLATSGSDRNRVSQGMRQVGGLYRRARLHAGLLRVELAGDLEIANCPANPVELAAHEAGLIPTADLPEQFPITFRQTCISRLQRPNSGN